MKQVLKFAALSSITILVACGGGDHGSGARNVSGTWTGALTKVLDECASTGTSTLSIQHQISQNQGAVTLVSNGVQYVGNVVGDNGLSVNATISSPGLSNCTDANQIEYDGIDDDNDTTAAVDIHFDRSCTGRATCRIQYTGTASRGVIADAATQGAATPTPRPGMTPTTVAISSGCAAMNPRPAAGSYSGDGGCGISSATMSLPGNGVVVLSPFGANGATSFNINASNSSSANSQRTDLTILGQTGSSCSMVCSPPGTFTVQCFQEGGTTCVEKF